VDFKKWLQDDCRRSVKWYRRKTASDGCLVQAVLIYALLSPFLCVCSMSAAVILWTSHSTPGPTMAWEMTDPSTMATPYSTYTPYPTYTPLPPPTKLSSPTPSPTPSVGSRKSPVPLGETYVCRADGREVELTIDHVVYGEEAVQMVMDANQFNDLPNEGYGFAVIHARAKYLSGDESRPWGVKEFDFVVVSENVVLRPPAIVDPEPSLDWQGFPGAEAEGWMTFLVASDDPSPVLVLVPGFGTDVSEGVWFALK